MRRFSDIIDLFEHRGEPDPQKVKERQQAHQRGLERHQNAQKRRKEEEKERIERQKHNSDKYNSNINKNTTTQNKKLQQKPVKQRLQEAKQQIEQNKQYQKIQNKKEHAQQKANEADAQLEQTISDIVTSAPTDSVKESAQNLSKNIKEINNQAKLEIESAKTDDEREKKKKEISDKYDQALKEAEDNLKTSEEKNWIRKVGTSKVMLRAKSAFDAWYELIGLKDIVEPAKDTFKKYLGLDKDDKSLESDAKEIDDKHYQKVTDKEMKRLGKRKKEHIKQLMKEGYTRAEAEDILTGVMNKRTGNDDSEYNEEQQDEKQDTKQKSTSKQISSKSKQLRFNDNNDKFDVNYQDIDSDNKIQKFVKDSSSRKLLADRKKNKNSIIDEYVKKGYSRDVATRMYYKETYNLIS